MAAVDSGRGALAVGVLDAQDEGAAVMAREEIVEERRAHAADVERARRDSAGTACGRTSARKLTEMANRKSNS